MTDTEHDEMTEPVRPAHARRYTYRDCLRGAVPVPRGTNGALLFQVLMVGGMVTFMVTINGIRNTGLGFLVHSHWLFPLVFCIAFLVRTFAGSKLVGFLEPRLIGNRLDGTAKAVAMTVLNVCCMAPIMCAIVTLLLNGADGFAVRYLTTLPITAPLAALVNYFVVGPVAKLLFNNRISPSGGLGFLEILDANSPSISRLLGF